jgi:hypothetical protein
MNKQLYKRNFLALTSSLEQKNPPYIATGDFSLIGRFGRFI